MWPEWGSLSAAGKILTFRLSSQATMHYFRFVQLKKANHFTSLHPGQCSFSCFRPTLPLTILDTSLIGKVLISHGQSLRRFCYSRWAST